MDWNCVVSLDTLLRDFPAVEQIVEDHGQAIIVSGASDKYLLTRFNPDTAPKREKTAPDLEQLLRSMGKGIFVKYFECFQDGQDPFVFMAEEHFSVNSVRSRMSRARTIFNNGWEYDALRNIAHSENVSPELRWRAKKLLAEHSEEV
ncbi:MAG: hypothetical protein IKN81_04360 [Oscillospiraceae bacterium]|nr:hypothetical protein [Oscillospiraceae bacterium]